MGEWFINCQSACLEDSKGRVIASNVDPDLVELMHAAPDLLEACKTSRALLIQAYGTNSPAVKRLNTAIAKAEGSTESKGENK